LPITDILRSIDGRVEGVEGTGLHLEARRRCFKKQFQQREEYSDHILALLSMLVVVVEDLKQPNIINPTIFQGRFSQKIRLLVKSCLLKTSINHVHVGYITSLVQENLFWALAQIQEWKKIDHRPSANGSIPTASTWLYIWVDAICIYSESNTSET